VRYRDKTWGHGIPQLTSDFCAGHGVKLATGLEGLLRAMDYLCRFPLRYIKEVRKVKGQDVHIMFDYMGTMGRQGATYTGEYSKPVGIAVQRLNLIEAIPEAFQKLLVEDALSRSKRVVNPLSAFASFNQFRFPKIAKMP
jgi:hypothetical protein